MTSGSPVIGTPIAIGLVPKMGSVVPCGATYSGDWLIATPIKPWRAMPSTQYLHIHLYWCRAVADHSHLAQSSLKLKSAACRRLLCKLGGPDAHLWWCRGMRREQQDSTTEASSPPTSDQWCVLTCGSLSR